MKKIFVLYIFICTFCLIFISALNVNAFLYTVDFESGKPTEFIGGTRISSKGLSAYGFENYLLWSDGSEISLKLFGLGAHDKVDIEFDLAVIDSWDGEDNGHFDPDYFNVYVDGFEAFRETFSNFDKNDQSYNGPEIVFGQKLIGLSRWPDSAYHIRLTDIVHNSNVIIISWLANGAGWQGGRDESFGIDNITVRTISSTVPEPATILLLGSCLLIVAVRKKVKI